VAFDSYPFDDDVTTEAQYSAMFRRMLQDGVLAAQGSNGLEVFADSSGMQVKVRSGSAAVRGHLFSSTAQETVSIAASGASTRIDYIVLKLDPSANSIVLTKVQGTAGAGAPALTQTDTGVYELPLAQVTISAGVITISSDKVTDMRTFSGVHTTAWTTATRPGSTGLGTPIKGQIGFNATTGKHEYYTGTAWADLFTSPTKVKAGIGTAAFGAGAFNKIVTFSFSGAGFTSAPYIVGSIVGSAGNSGKCALRVISSSTSSGSMQIYNEDGGVVTGNIQFHWHAIEGS
jgi:hypothetical protein